MGGGRGGGPQGQLSVPRGHRSSSESRGCYSVFTQEAPVPQPEPREGAGQALPGTRGPGRGRVGRAVPPEPHLRNGTARWAVDLSPSVILALGRIEGDAGFLELTTPASGSV